MKRFWQRIPAWAWVLVIWAVMFLPKAGTREVRWEEGRRGLIARAMIEECHWIQQTVCGQPYRSKPPMLPWLIALSARVTNGLNEWAIRLPGMLAVLVAGLVVCAMTSASAGRAGSVFAASAFFLCPLILEKARVGETDTLVTCCSFAAFWIWLKPWHAWHKTLLTGLALAVGALAKGPPALLYFACGALTLLLWERQYRLLPWFFLTLGIGLGAVALWAATVYEPGAGDLWLSQMQRNPQHGFHLGPYLLNCIRFLGGAIGGSAPWCLLALWAFKANRALAAYAIAGTVVMMFWPESRSRYALPMMPAIAVAAGLAFHKLLASPEQLPRQLVRVTAAVMILLATGWCIAITLRRSPEPNRQAARALNSIFGDQPVYALQPAPHNLLFYVQRPVTEISLKQLAAQKTPATLLYRPSLTFAIADARIPLEDIREISPLVFMARVRPDGK